MGSAPAAPAPWAARVNPPRSSLSRAGRLGGQTAAVCQARADLDALRRRVDDPLGVAPASTCPSVEAKLFDFAALGSRYEARAPR